MYLFILQQRKPHQFNTQHFTCLYQHLALGYPHRRFCDRSCKIIDFYSIELINGYSTWRLIVERTLAFLETHVLESLHIKTIQCLINFCQEITTSTSRVKESQISQFQSKCLQVLVSFISVFIAVRSYNFSQLCFQLPQKQRVNGTMDIL